MKKPLLLLAAASLLPLAACSSGAQAPRAALDCPATQGELTRTDAAADGKSCTYASNGGAEITLRLVPVTGSAYATLDQLEAALVAEDESAAKTKALEAGATADARPGPVSAGDTRRAAEEAAQDAAGVEVSANGGSDGGGVDVRVKGGKVVVAEGGSTTRVNLPGIQIEADENEDSASIRIGPLHVNASGDEARIRIRRDVRLKGEALSREKRGVRATFILGDRGGEQGRFLGYEAGGPKTGPLAVAVVRGAGKLDHSDEVYDDMKRLVRKNGGV